MPKSWRYYLGTGLILFAGILLLGRLAYWQMFFIKKTNFTDSYYYFFVLIPKFINIIFGVLLGAELLFNEIKKAGRWGFNYRKFILLGIPALIFSFYDFFMFFFHCSFLPQIMENLLMAEKFKVSVFAGIILGYTIVSSFYKQLPVSGDLEDHNEKPL